MTSVENVRSKRPPNAPKRPLDEDYAYEQDADYRQIQKLKPSPVESKRENVSALHQARSIVSQIQLSSSFSHAKVTLESIID